MRARKCLTLAVTILVPATAWAQVGGPVQPEDMALGLSLPSAADTAQLVRGGALQGGWQQNSFLQSMEFDNLGGVTHNALGNLLALNFGTSGGGGSIWSLATDGTDVAEMVFAFDGTSTPITRIAGLSVSPNNRRIALFGLANLSLFILDYQAGNGNGTGAAITASIEEPGAFIPGGTQSTTWFDTDSVLLYRLDPAFNPETQLVMADIVAGGLTLTVVTDDIPVAGGMGSQYTDVEYIPAIAPWVICSYSDFSGGTENTLTFIDPSNWSIVHQISLSASLQTAREIALGEDGKLYLSAYGGSAAVGPIIDVIDLDANGDGTIDASDLPLITDNSSVDFYQAVGLQSSFNGIDIAGGGEPVIMFDGDFDGLTVADNPDCGNNAGAGAWYFGTSYTQGGVCEASPGQMTVVATDSFDPGANGNSLHLLIVADPDTNVHLPNRFNFAIPEGDLVTVTFDIWVVAGGGGGSVYVGADHGGGGYSSVSDRGPQLSWFPDGTLQVSEGTVRTTVANYPVDEWQSVRMEIDIVADTYDLFWGPRGGPLDQVGDDVAYRSGPMDRLDRFTFVNFGEFMADANSYLDDVTVTLDLCAHDPCDMNCDGVINAVDIEFFIDILFSGAIPCDVCTGDTNGDGMVSAADIEGFINCLFP